MFCGTMDSGFDASAPPRNDASSRPPPRLENASVAGARAAPIGNAADALAADLKNHVVAPSLQPPQTRNGAVASAVPVHYAWIGPLRLAAGGSDPHWHCWRGIARSRSRLMIATILRRFFDLPQSA
jgi:hypothetical protein